MRDELKVVVAPSQLAHWYALRVQPQKEYVVAYLLRKQDVRTIVPTETRFRRRTRYQRSKAEFAHPEIPGCVFAGFAGEPAWYHLLRNSLIIGVEGHHGTPIRLDAGKLHEYFARTLDGCMVIVDDREDETRHGLRLVQVPGRGLIRSPTTQVRAIAKRKAKDSIVVEPTGRRDRLLSQFVLAIPEPVRAAA